MPRYDWTEVEMQYSFHVIKEKNITTSLDSKQVLANKSKQSPSGQIWRDLTTITVYVLQTIQWKLLQTVTELCRKF